jgi:hypothetical protein
MNSLQLTFVRLAVTLGIVTFYPAHRVGEKALTAREHSCIV